MYQNPFQIFSASFRKRPHAIAMMMGEREHASISGIVRLYQTQKGVLVVSEIMGLPIPSERCRYPIFGFHIHRGNGCTGTEGDPHADTLSRFDPHRCVHLDHAGDLPSLFGAGGDAFSAVLTDLELEPDPVFPGGLCDHCGACAAACPACALDRNTLTEAVYPAGTMKHWRLRVESCRVCTTGTWPRPYSLGLEPNRTGAACGRACCRHLEGKK